MLTINFNHSAKNLSNSLGMTKDGKLFSFGDNTYGQLGVGLTKDQTIPNRIGNDSSWTFVTSGIAHCLAILNVSGQSAGMNDGSEINERFSRIQVYPNPTNDLLHLDFSDRISTAPGCVSAALVNPTFSNAFTKTRAAS